ncbi:hypothetical protein L6164_007773 [Bauhinia variegata]|uniref:Uncharacterized protein n=1 Tax=Bauhinia variegata TaxID=167791 RepID=A0ACB9PK23_BAUVA|nr:hypothetical protein L6164_007773 [Bauhinia variegata]
MATDHRFALLEETKRNMVRRYKTSRSKIQTVPSYMREQEKYEKYYSPKLISFGPIHHGDPKLKRGEQYKLMWASMYADASSQTPQDLHKRIADNISEVRELFSWDELRHAQDYSNEDLAWMLFVDGCSVLQILDKANFSKPEDLIVKVDMLVVLERDLFLLENQLPYQLLQLLSEDEMKLKISMQGFCELQNMFTALGSLQSLLFKEPKQHQIEILKKSAPPTHLLDCLRTSILSSGTESTNEDKEPMHDIERGKQSSPTSEGETESAEDPFNIPRMTDRSDGPYRGRIKDTITIALYVQKAALQFLYKDGGLWDVPYTYANRNKSEKHTSFRTIQELKAAAIRVKRQKNICLKNISFSSSIFGGKLHLPPLILDDSTVPTLLKLAAYELCPDFINEFEISSYLKLLDLLIDYPEDVKELRSSGILHNSLGCDEEVVELFNTISSGLVHNPFLYSGLTDEVEKHYKNKLSIWMADLYYTYFKSPWTVIAVLAALLALVLTALQTWQGFKSNSK